MTARARDLVPLVRSNVLVLDARRLSREAFCRLLEAASFCIVGEGPSLDEAVVGLHPENSPDLILHHFESDMEMVKALPQISTARDRFRGAKSAVLSDCLDNDALCSALQSGVEAFLSRDISADVLQRALELVLLGQRIMPGGLAQTMLHPQRANSLSAVSRTAGEARASVESISVPACTLSKREYEILGLLVAGKSNKAIARELDISEATVKVHVKGLLRKTRLTNRTQAAIWGMNQRVSEHSSAADGPLVAWAASPSAVG